MIFTETELKGAYIIDLEKNEDERGFFARSWCQREFSAHGLDARLVQCNMSFNSKKGTLRGMHFQAFPYEEAKVVQCIRGSIYDVIVDLSKGSPTFGQHFGFILSADNRKMLFVPKMFGHGFLTLEDNTEVFYQMSEFFAPENARGFRWNDPSFGIKWPAEVKIISDRDKTYPDFNL
jgi:dTDP-4-dehydrorhamnose 3,5-epimerase